jgi:hypothetical protein
MECQYSAFFNRLRMINGTYDSLVHIRQCLVHLRIWIEGTKLLDRKFAALLHAYQLWYELERMSVGEL